MALLLPALKKAMVTAKQVGCMANLRTIYTGELMYLEESNYCYMPWYGYALTPGLGYEWEYQAQKVIADVLGDYSAFEDPARGAELNRWGAAKNYVNLEDNYDGHWYTIPGLTNGKYIAYNAVWTTAGQMVTRIASPAARPRWLCAQHVYYYIEDGGLYPDNFKRFAERHADGYNVLYVDGSIRWRHRVQPPSGKADYQSLNWVLYYNDYVGK